MRLPRCETLDCDEILVAHVHNQTAQNCFLAGDDPVTGKNFDHREAWIEQTNRHFAACFGIDLIGFAILPDQFHLILRSRPDVVATWDDHEVARRWLLICPLRRTADRQPETPSDIEIAELVECAEKLAKIRHRLSDISWWPRLLCQPLASRSNREDNQRGHFFRDRFGSSLLADEASLLACSVFVDLSLIRTALAEDIQTSDHTAAQLRRVDCDAAQTIESAPPSNSADFLSPVKNDHPSNLDDSSGPPNKPKQVKPGGLADPHQLAGPGGPADPHQLGEPGRADASFASNRCSDNGFLTISLESYLELLDWVTMQPNDAPVTRVPPATATLLRRLDLDAAAFLELSRDFGKLFSAIAGKCGCVDAMRSRRTSRRFYMRRRARELMRGRRG